MCIHIHVLTYTNPLRLAHCLTNTETWVVIEAVEAVEAVLYRSERLLWILRVCTQVEQRRRRKTPGKFERHYFHILEIYE